MKMTNKLGLMTGVLAGTLALNGCMTPEQAEQNRRYAAEYEAKVARGEIKENEFNNFMDGMANAFFSGGGLFYAAGNSAAQQGNFQRANSYNTLGRIQEQNYNRETQIQAAREGRSDVIVNVNEYQQPALERYRDSESIILDNWFDVNGNNILDQDSDLLIRRTDKDFTQRSIVLVGLNTDVFGNEKYRITVELAGNREIITDLQGFIPQNINPTRENLFQYGARIPVRSVLDSIGLAPYNAKGKHEFIIKAYIGNNQSPSSARRFTIDFDQDRT